MSFSFLFGYCMKKYNWTKFINGPLSRSNYLCARRNRYFVSVLDALAARFHSTFEFCVWASGIEKLLGWSVFAVPSHWRLDCVKCIVMCCLWTLGTFVLQRVLCVILNTVKKKIHLTFERFFCGLHSFLTFGCMIQFLDATTSCFKTGAFRQRIWKFSSLLSWTCERWLLCKITTDCTLAVKNATQLFFTRLATIFSQVTNFHSLHRSSRFWGPMPVSYLQHRNLGWPPNLGSMCFEQKVQMQPEKLFFVRIDWVFSAQSFFSFGKNRLKTVALCIPVHTHTCRWKLASKFLCVDGTRPNPCLLFHFVIPTHDKGGVFRIFKWCVLLNFLPLFSDFDLWMKTIWRDGVMYHVWKCATNQRNQTFHLWMIVRTRRSRTLVTESHSRWFWSLTSEGWDLNLPKSSTQCKCHSRHLPHTLSQCWIKRAKKPLWSLWQTCHASFAGSLQRTKSS